MEPVVHRLKGRSKNGSGRVYGLIVSVRSYDKLQATIPTPFLVLLQFQKQHNQTSSSTNKLCKFVKPGFTPLQQLLWR